MSERPAVLDDEVEAFYRELRAANGGRPARAPALEARGEQLRARAEALGWWDLASDLEISVTDYFMRVRVRAEREAAARRAVSAAERHEAAWHGGDGVRKFGNVP